MPSIRNPKMPARPTVARRSAGVMLAAAPEATAGGARSCGMGLTMGRRKGARERSAGRNAVRPTEHLRNACGMAV